MDEYAVQIYDESAVPEVGDLDSKRESEQKPASDNNIQDIILIEDHADFQDVLRSSNKSINVKKEERLAEEDAADINNLLEADLKGKKKKNLSNLNYDRRSNNLHLKFNLEKVLEEKRQSERRQKDLESGQQSQHHQQPPQSKLPPANKYIQ